VGNVVWSRKRGVVAGDNPWGAGTLEWAMSSPPPSYNFMYLPTVQGRYPLWENANSPVIVGLSTQKREVLSTTILDAAPEHRFELAIDSIWPLALSVAAGGSFIGAIFDPWAIPIGAALSLVVLTLWFWRGNEPHSIVQGIQQTPHPPREQNQLELKERKV